MTSKAQDFLLTLSFSDAPVQQLVLPNFVRAGQQGQPELSHPEYEQLLFIHSCQSS